ncbi:MAG: GTP-binding protein [Ectothiorhodospiraceae bacterium]|nr:GTP-binding protein [Ectothiorhodospiraceae bacterium]
MNCTPDNRTPPAAGAPALEAIRETPCHVLTGFLGSGKTTLLRHVLEHGLDGRRVAVLMNEIGDIGIDGRSVDVLDGIGSMVELNSGCVCCTIDISEFTDAYHAIVSRIAPDLVIIETTGVALPEPILDRLEGVAADCDAVITVVDAENYDACAQREPALERQVLAADFIVVNKSDLATTPALEALESRLRRLNPRAAVLRCEQGRAPVDVLFAPDAHRLRLAVSSRVAQHDPRPHQHDIQAFSYASDAPVDTARFLDVVRRLPPAILRAKGILVPTTGAPLLFNLVCGRLGVERRPTLRGRARASEAVFIGYGVDALRSSIVDALQRCGPDAEPVDIER